MTEKYQVLARRYRPQKFNDVFGQENIVKTIKNAIKFNRSSHAYLFAGSRGIGKTTLARLFAKALNCQNLSPEQEPCNKCSSCMEVTSDCSLDVIEIDGASNRGIDDIRQINETVGYAPSCGKYKIYIIDEVHMLTKEAFNALLKTLEEPPPTIKFFFATTEPHKVLQTIISRCQRFDLTRLSNQKIMDKLTSIITDLDRKVTKDALCLIANSSQGSLRDAESLLDQLLCYEEGEITEKIVNKTIGITPREYFFELDKAAEEQNHSFAFNFIEKIYISGQDLSRLVEELIDHFRTILILKLKLKTQNLSENLSEKYIASTKLYTSKQCIYILELLVKSLDQFQRSPFKRVFVETLILQIIRSKNRIPIEALVKKLHDLERQIHLKKSEAPLPKKEEKVELEQVPFNIEENKSQNIKENQTKIDTMMRFSAVELEGVVKTDN
jgi:DNA polymerase III subunit gamma/tau